jgi:hypothetical protein
MKKTLKTSPDSRKCSFPGCNCILSIYNHEAFCRVHRDKVLQEQKTKIATNLEVPAE